MKLNIKPAINKDNWIEESGSVNVLVEVRPYNMKELCALYKMSYKVMYTFLAPLKGTLGKKRGHFYSVRQVEAIFNELGVPYLINEKI